MLFFLKSKENNVVYFLKDVLTVGRRDGDIAIANDQSISRRHALIKKENEKIILVDCGSKYKTFVDNVVVEANKNIEITPGSSIKFGIYESIYRLEAIDIVTLTSCLNSSDKKQVTQNVTFLKGHCLNNWTDNCTHLTVNEIKLTVKVLCSLIDGIPIVVVKFWDDFVNCVKENRIPPDPSNYKPSCTEILINKNFPFEYKPERKTLFRDKIFIFPTEKELKAIDIVIKYAGGECVSWDQQPIPLENLEKSSKQYIIIQNIENQEEEQSPSYLNFVECYRKLGKQQIPFTDIALAIINCSCEKYSNPFFKRNDILISTEELIFPQKILAINTQTQNFEEMIPSCSVTIPQTYENSVCSSQKNLSKDIDSSFGEQEKFSFKTSKRSAEECVEKLSINDVKKKKQSNITNLFIKNENRTSIFDKRTEHIDDKSQLFDFFSNNKENDGNYFTSSSSSSTTIDIVSECTTTKKRKFLFDQPNECESLHQIKKSNIQNGEREIENWKVEEIIPNSHTSSNIEGVNFENNFHESISQNLSHETETATSLAMVKLDTAEWLSKSSDGKFILQEGSEEGSQLENDLMKSVVIEIELISSQNKTTNDSTSFILEGKRNFKTFKKVKPLIETTTILSQLEIAIVTGNNSTILEFNMSNEGEEETDDEFDKMAPPIENQKNRKKFQFNL